MQAAKEKVSNLASAAKQKVNVTSAKAQEKVETATARTEEERAISHESRKAKEAQAKAELHQEKAGHAGDKLLGKQSHHLLGRNHHPHAVDNNQYAGGYSNQPQPVVGNAAHAGNHLLGHHQPAGTAAPVAPNYHLGGQPHGHVNKHKYI